jgi:hypothetical protein
MRSLKSWRGRSVRARHGGHGARMTPKRSCGTGQLTRKHGAWYGRSRTSDGRRLNRRIGAVRGAGEADGLTRREAERRFRTLQEQEERPAPTQPHTSVSPPASAPSSSRTGSSITPTRPMRAAWTGCGACTSGWTGRRRGATRPGRGGAGETSTKPEDWPRARLATGGRVGNDLDQDRCVDTVSHA